MAQDQVEVMEQLGYREFFVAGHDRGARTDRRMCLDHPDRVKRAALIDILPNHHIWTHASKNWALHSWHWLFMAQPYDFPERMMAGVPAQWFMEKKLSKPGIGLGFFDPEAFAEYVRCFNWKTIKRLLRGLPRLRRPATSRWTTADFEGRPQDRRAAAGDLGRKAATPGRSTAMCSRCGAITPPMPAAARSDCGHYVPEEAPDAVFDVFMRHFG